MPPQPPAADRPVGAGARSAAPVPFMDLAAMAREVWPAVGDELVTAMLDAAYIGGPAVAAFEQDWAAYCGAAHCVGVANGTDALLLTLEALGVGAGDEVLVPANTFIATAEAVVRVGATPRFVDVDPDTLLVTADALEEAITPLTRAAIVVHLYGQMADMDAIGELSRRTGLLLVEDAAQAHGARWRSAPVGTVSAAACFSFYPGKNLGAFGDAGAVVTADADLARIVRTLANHGRQAGGHYEHDLVGTNSRLDAVQAIALRGKLALLDRWTATRVVLAGRYRARLHGSAAQLVAIAPQARHVHHLFVVQVERRDEVRARLAGRGIATGVHYPVPCHLQPPLRSCPTGPPGDGPPRALPVSERSAARLLSLPLYPHLSLAAVDRVCDELLDVLAELDRQDAGPPVSLGAGR